MAVDQLGAHLELMESLVPELPLGLRPQDPVADPRQRGRDDQGAGAWLAEPVLPPFPPDEVLLHELFKRGAGDEVVQAPPGGDVADDQHPLPVPAQRQVTEEAADAPDGLPPALPAR